MTEADVRKVDKDNKEDHREAWCDQEPGHAANAMVFQRDASMLDKVQAGDKVRFKASGEGGKFTVTDLQRPSKR